MVIYLTNFSARTLHISQEFVLPAGSGTTPEKIAFWTH